MTSARTGESFLELCGITRLSNLIVGFGEHCSEKRANPLLVSTTIILALIANLSYARRPPYDSETPNTL